MSDISHIRKKHGWIYPVHAERAERDIKNAADYPEQARMSEEDVRFVAGVVESDLMSDDPSDKYDAHKACVSVIGPLMRHVWWLTARLRTLEASTPADTGALADARVRIGDLERAVKDAAYALSQAVPPSPAQTGRG